jgi:hypothetical protein
LQSRVTHPPTSMKTKRREYDMRKLNMYGLALLAVCLVGLIGSPSALATLPEFSLLAGKEFPVTGEGTSRADPHGVKLENLIAQQVFAEQVKASLEIASAGPSGTLTLQFTNMKSGKAKCNTLGLKEGSGTLVGELRLVPTSKEGSQIGALITFAENTISCKEEGKEVSKLKIKAPTIAAVIATVLEKGEEVMSFGLVAKCGGTGKQELSSYFNDEEKAVEKQLLELGGFTGCMELKDELPIFLNQKVIMPTTTINKNLPYIQVLTENYPISLEGSTKTEVKVESPGKFGFSVTEVKYSLESAKVGPSGPITLRLTGVKEKASGASCNNEGGGAGEVLLTGEYHLVFTSLAPLAVGLLVTFPELVVKCVVNFEMNGPLILGVKVGFKEAVTSIGISAKCKETGRQEPSSYYVEEKKLVELQLIIWRRNKSPLEDACFSTGAEVTASGKKKFLIAG